LEGVIVGEANASSYGYANFLSCFCIHVAS